MNQPEFISKYAREMTHISSGTVDMIYFCKHTKGLPLTLSEGE